MAANLENNHNSQPNPSGIWQALWLKLISQALEQTAFRQYLDAWETLKLLKTQLPPECEKDCKKGYMDAEKVFSQQIQRFSLNQTIRARANYISKNAPNVLLQLLGDIRTSLYEHKWITKDTGYSGIDPNKESIGF